MSKNKSTLMAHMIPFYPDEAQSFALVETLVEAGIRYLEIQFPFSDPSADGPVIEAACMEALRQGFTVDKGFAFVRSVQALCAEHGVEIFVMTYASLVYNRGVEAFVGAAKAAGVTGLIVPDLPPDSDEGLYAACARSGLACVPVVVPSISRERLAMVLGMRLPYLYCALRAGITGQKTGLDEKLLAFLRQLSGQGAKVLGGFGIAEPGQVVQLRDTVHAVVVGSAIVRALNQGSVEAAGQLVRSMVDPQ